MALGYLLGGGVSREPVGLELYRAYPVMRDLYDQVADWCSLPLSMLLEDDVPEAPEARQAIGAVRLAALSIAVHDILAESGVHPSVIGGLSLGGLAGAALVGAVSRQQMFQLMVAGVDFPGWPPSSPPQGMAVVNVPNGQRIETYLAGHTRVHKAVWVGESASGAGTFVVVGGEADALVRLAEANPGVVTPIPTQDLAIHTPIREPFRAFLAPYLARLEFTDPKLPLYAALEKKQLTTADEIRDMFDRNPVDPVYLPHIHGGMSDAGVDLAVVVSASISDGMLRLPFPTVHVERPEDIHKVLSTIYELDIRYPQKGVPA